MDLTTLLAETAPVVAPPGEDALTAARARLDAEATAAARTVGLVRRAKRRRRGLLLGSVAAACALILVPVLGEGRNTAQAAAAEVLLAAADAAADQAGGWPDAAYWHVVSEIEYAGEDPHQREVWRAQVGNGVLQEPAIDPATGLSTPGDPYTTDLGPTIFFAGGVIDWAGLYALPTDATELEKTLRAGINGAGPDDDTELWTIVMDLLRESPAPPALRRALWQVAATIPGIELVGTTTDTSGRPGTGIERDMTDIGRSIERYILDPLDGRVLEYQSLDAAGNPTFRMTVLEQGPSATAPAADPPICGPGSDPYTSC